MWFTPDHGPLSIQSPLCWEQKNHSPQNQPNCARNVEWIPLELQPSFPMKGQQLVGNDLATPPRYLLGSPKWGPLVLWHKSLVMAPTWVVCPWCLGFPWAQGITSWKQWWAPLLETRRAYSVFDWYCHLAPVFVSSIGFAYIAACIALVKFSH